MDKKVDNFDRTNWKLIKGLRRAGIVKSFFYKIFVAFLSLTVASGLAGFLHFNGFRLGMDRMNFVIFWSTLQAFVSYKWIVRNHIGKERRKEKRN